MVRNYAHDQARWFETIANYTPSDDFLCIFHELAPSGWNIAKSAVWYVAHPPAGQLIDQGWKIHISASTSVGAEVLRAALPIIFDTNTYVKFAADGWLLSEINSKLWPREASGKFLTLYPSATELFMRLGDLLAAALAEFSGPYILSDRR